jgi:hypothetical protein
MGETEERRLRVGRRFDETTFPTKPPEACRLVNRELITGDVVGSEPDRLIQVLLPARFRLSGRSSDRLSNPASRALSNAARTS